MCTLVYIASDAPIPLEPWDSARPGFHVRHVDDLEQARLRHLTSKARVYYVGTSEKCGCPFSYGANPGVDDSPAELEARTEALDRLRHAVEGALTSSASVELLVFEAAEWTPPKSRRRIRVEDLSTGAFAFTPPEIVQVERAA